jgi:hypothetical protein
VLFWFGIMLETVRIICLKVVSGLVEVGDTQQVYGWMQSGKIDDRILADPPPPMSSHIGSILDSPSP